MHSHTARWLELPSRRHSAHPANAPLMYRQLLSLVVDLRVLPVPDCKLLELPLRMLHFEGR